MAKGYKQLTYDQRCQIDTLKASGKSGREIGEQLGVHQSTTNRELKRNKGKRGYRYKQAQAKSQERRAARKGIPRKMTAALKKQIEEKLALQWSPEQIAGWLKRENKDQAVISHESIYQYVLEDKKAGGSLYKNLRRKAKKYFKRINGKTRRGQIKDRVGIEKRPAIVEERSRLGDWEGDTIVGKDHQGAIVSLVERKSRYTLLRKVEKRKAERVKMAITLALNPFKGLALKTLTYDNGKEFAEHAAISESLEVQTYFARPYHSWERGTNENTNGLVRQYFPKKTDFATLSEEDVARVQYLLNNRPRKCLGYRTPAEVIQSAA